VPSHNIANTLPYQGALGDVIFLGQGSHGIVGISVEPNASLPGEMNTRRATSFFFCHAYSYNRRRFDVNRKIP
jgi:hypothetical protein